MILVCLAIRTLTETTELDKTIVEEIADPLLHLIRNSLDHGLAAPVVSEVSGKPKQGAVRLEARREGDFILIQVVDDGKGIDGQQVVSSSDAHRSDSGEGLRARSQILPFGRVNRTFNQSEPIQNQNGHLRVVILSVAEKKLGFLVDDFLGQEKTIVRPLSSQLGHPPGVAGGTTTGEGNTRFILDPAGLVDMFVHQEA